jgi:phytoene/squalene synthetase
MIELYNSVSNQISKKITNVYSTSFSWGIRAFEPSYQTAIYAIYGFVRIADEIVDSFNMFDKKKLLEKFKNDTMEAINDGISVNPVLHAFQRVVHKYEIPVILVTDFLASMEMDLYETSHERAGYDKYIYGSAEVVGLMCLHVFCYSCPEKYEKLVHPARKLGAAFQKVNFLRDIDSDLYERGRIYLPGVHTMADIDDVSKVRLEREIAYDFREALDGIRQLPAGVKLGVYSAYLYYYYLYRKIQKMNLKKLMQKRVSVSALSKLSAFLRSYVEIKILMRLT